VVKFDGGQPVVEHWDGRDRWVRYQYDRPETLVSAEIDPDHGIWLDRNFFNNSYVEQGDARATHKFRNLWVFCSEWLSQLLAWLT